METAQIKKAVRRQYTRAARRASCCGGGTANPITRDLYAPAEIPEGLADMVGASLGCGNPVALAELQPGEIVLDLGSGAGLDVLLAASRVGPAGMAYGLDMTEEMLKLARRNQRKAGIKNARFLKGDMEDMPLPDNSVDVVVSNCVVNLSPDKDSVLKEAFRVLRPGGRLAIADIVIRGELPLQVMQSLEAWAGCIAGALKEKDYREKLEAAGFEKVSLENLRTFSWSDLQGTAVCSLFPELSPEKVASALEKFVSVFVRATKPAQ